MLLDHISNHRTVWVGKGPQSSSYSNPCHGQWHLPLELFLLVKSNPVLELMKNQYFRLVRTNSHDHSRLERSWAETRYILRGLMNYKCHHNWRFLLWWIEATQSNLERTSLVELQLCQTTLFTSYGDTDSPFEGSFPYSWSQPLELELPCAPGPSLLTGPEFPEARPGKAAPLGHAWCVTH